MKEAIRKEYIFKDPELGSADTVPKYVSARFSSCGCDLFGIIMLPDGRFEGPRPCVIFSHGYPGQSVLDDIANALCRAGCVTVTYHYRGSWGSKGKYLFTNDIEDLKNITEYMRTEGAEKYRVDPDRIYLAGHSVGGFSTINAGKDLAYVRGLVLMAPYDPTAYVGTEKENMLKMLCAFNDMLVSDGTEALFENITENIDDISFINAADKLSEKNVLLVTAALDAIAPPADMAEPLWSRIKEKEGVIHRIKEYSAEHGLYGARTNVSYDIAEFIEETI